MSQNSIIRLLGAELSRLVKLPGLYLAIGFAVAANLGTLFQLAESTMKLDVQSALIAPALLQIPMLVWAAQYGASAFETGSITRFTFLAGTKNKSLIIRLAAVTAVCVMAISVTFVLSLASITIVTSTTHASFFWGNVLWPEDLRISAVVCWFTLIGYFAGLLTRSRAIASAGSLAIVMVPAVTFLLTAPALAQYMPLEIASRFVVGPDSGYEGSVSFLQSASVLTAGLLLIGVSGWLRATSRRTKKS